MSARMVVRQALLGVPARFSASQLTDIVLNALEKAGLRIVHASALGNEAVARVDVQAVLEHLVENGRTALDTSAGHAYRESASKVEELLGRPSQGLPRVNDVLDGA